MVHRDKVFVYGSLRRGQRYRPLIEEFVLEEKAAWARGRIYHFAPPGSRGAFPYMTAEEGRVRGEVLRLRDPERAFKILDDLEDHPDLYRRTEIEVEYSGGGRERVYAYLIVPERDPGGDPIPSGDWLDALGDPE